MNLHACYFCSWMFLNTEKWSISSYIILSLCDIMVSVKFNFSIYLSGFFNSCLRLPETKRHSSLFLHWSSSEFLSFLLPWLLVLVPSTFFLDVLFSFSCGIHSIINFGILSSGILLTWLYHCSLFLSMMSGSPFTPIISFICSFFYSFHPWFSCWPP